LREQERAERGRAREKRQYLLKESTHPKANSNTNFEAADNKEEQVVQYGFEEVVHPLMCTVFEGDNSKTF
jgi:hypothetical protein